MSTKSRAGIALAFLLAAALLSRPAIDHLGARKTLRGNTPECELSTERTAIMNPDALVSRLGIRPGSTVLDLGAGFGMFTFRLARAAGPGGRVFATDIDPQAIAQLAARAGQEGFANVEPVCVRPCGLDPFYRRHTFDVIYASDMITEIRGAEKFFDELRPSLRPESGRLWIVSMRPDPDFTAAEFGAPGALRRALLSGARPAPLLRRLSEAARLGLDAEPAAPDDGAFAAAAVADLNRLLEDATLWPESQAQQWPLRQQDASLRSALSALLAKRGMFTARSRPDDDARRALRLLNRLLIADLLGSERWGKAIALNTLTPAQLRPLLAPLTFQTFWGRPAFLETVGYEAVGERSENPYCCVWEYRRAR